MSQPIINEEVKQYYSPSILKEACANYDINSDDAKLIRGNANLIFDCGDKILRLSHSCIRKKIDIESEVDWLIYLKEKDLPVVKILLSKTNEHLVQIGVDENHFTSVCFEKIYGQRISNENWDHLHFERLGQITGSLHRVGQQYKEKENIVYKNWNEIMEFESWKYLPKDERGLVELHNQLVNEFLSYPKTESTYGLIHYDIHHGNYLLTDDQQELIVFDFEMTCKSWYINDIASILHYASYHPASQKLESFDQLFMDHFRKGYSKEYSLEETDLIKIPKFVLYRDLLVYGFIHNLYTSDKLRTKNQFYFDRLSNAIAKRRIELKI